MSEVSIWTVREGVPHEIEAEHVGEIDGQPVYVFGQRNKLSFERRDVFVYFSKDLDQSWGFAGGYFKTEEAAWDWLESHYALSVFAAKWAEDRNRKWREQATSDETEGSAP
jgi:hypothetical protein